MDAEGSLGLNRKSAWSHAGNRAGEREEDIWGSCSEGVSQPELCVKGSLLGGLHSPALVNIGCGFPEAPQTFQRWAVSPCICL